MKQIELDYVQIAVIKHALECLEEDVFYNHSYCIDAQTVINELPPRKRYYEKSPQSVNVVISEILQKL